MNEIDKPRGLVEWVLYGSLTQPLLVVLGTVLLVLWGLSVSPFAPLGDALPRNPVPVDALPDLGENQQIIFTDWMGRSPYDVENQVTYPLTVQLMGVPGVKEVRATSMMGFSTISLIFDEGTEFYWARSRVLERLNSLPVGLLPEGVLPTLGPDATGLGQVYWYTLEGRDPEGRPVGGWDLHTLRTLQDFTVRYALLSAEGISEVASVGGFVQQYVVEADPNAMRAAGVMLEDVFRAVQQSNLDVGARTIELNQVEYVVRGVGLIQSVTDLENAPVAVRDRQVPIRIRDVARVTLGPAERRGVLNKDGAEAVGGVAVVRFGYNPREAISNLQERIDELAPSLPARVVLDWTRITPEQANAFAFAEGFEGFLGAEPNHEAWTQWLRSVPSSSWPEWVTLSQLTVVPYYDRSVLIAETLGTLSDALTQQVLITLIVIILMLLHLRVSLLVSLLLPLSVLLSFIAMKLSGIEANLVSLAGIAIAIGTVVDMGIILSESVVREAERAPNGQSRIATVFAGTRSVGGAVLTAIATTVLSFLPVFAMTGPEGKLFKPLAYTKTFVLLAAILLTLTILPVTLLTIAKGRKSGPTWSIPQHVRHRVAEVGIGLGTALFLWGYFQGVWWMMGSGIWSVLGAGWGRVYAHAPAFLAKRRARVHSVILVFPFLWSLAHVWMPLGKGLGLGINVVFVTLLVVGLLLFFFAFERAYPHLLLWAQTHRRAFFALPITLVVLGALVWLGTPRVLGFLPERVHQVPPISWIDAAFPGLGREFMPALDEGAFLFMPTTMPHASVGEAADVLAFQNAAIRAIPEVAAVVGKVGRVESALDPAPVSMVETLIQYHPEFATTPDGRVQRFVCDERGLPLRDGSGHLTPDPTGCPARLWRPHIRTPQDIWDEIVEAANLPGVTTAPKLQPIETRLVMLQTGMRAPMGIKVRGPNQEILEQATEELVRFVRRVPEVESATVNADRALGKPYLEFHIRREEAARYGLSVEAIQNVIAMAVGGMEATRTLEGRERFSVIVRYPRDERMDVEALGRILVPVTSGEAMGESVRQVPLREVAELRFVRGPEMLRSEDTFPVTYLTFGGVPGVAEVNVVEAVQRFLNQEREEGRLVLPAGVTYTFAGTYQHQLHAAQTLRVVLPVALLLIFLVLYLQFRSTSETLIVFSGIAVAWAGGFFMLWMYGQPWFGNFYLLGANLREVFNLHAVYLSVAVWVGFLALFGIATDDGVVMLTYLKQRFAENPPQNLAEIRQAVVEAGLRRIRPCLMTSATTILALLPLLTADGRGADLMMPMALPTLGGMTIVLLSMFMVPVLYGWRAEKRL